MELTMQMVKAHGGNAALGVFDERIKTIKMRRQSERIAFPLSNFPNGLSNLTKIMGQEYSALLLQVMCVLASDTRGSLLPEKDAKEVVKALDSLYSLWILLEQSSHNVNEVLTEYPKRIERYACR